MKKLKCHLVAAMLCAVSTIGHGFAGELSTTRPASKDVERHTGFLEDIKKMHGLIDLVFVGDSITDFWRSGGQSVWQKHFAPLKALNLGISGDRTEHVLWRLQNGELDGYEARLFVVMIGTNNLDSAPDVAEGIKAILKEIRGKQPQANILLLAIFPRGEKPADPLREKNEEVNKIIAKFDDNQTVHYMDINSKFLEPDKSLSKSVMDDFLHPNAHGYEIWANAINEMVKKLLQESSTAALAGPGPYKKLANLAAQIKTGAGLGQVLKTLAAKKDSTDAEEAAEAKMMFEALKGGGQSNLELALSFVETKPLLAVARLDLLAAQFAGDDIGAKAKQAAEKLHKDPKITKELEAEKMFKQLQTFEEAFKPVGGSRDPKNAQFRKMNAQGIETLIGGCQQLMQRYAGTAAAAKAEALLSLYAPGQAK